MRAIVVPGPGDESVLQIGDVPRPALGPADVRIRVSACGITARSPPAPGPVPAAAGASPILGLECAGDVAEMGPEDAASRSGSA
jgi:NADPH:quinone reductase-like Zn-dependent oxidoreductase